MRNLGLLLLMVLALVLVAQGSRTKRAEDVLAAVRLHGPQIDIGAQLPPATQDALLCTTLAVFCESRREIRDGRLAVAMVVRNRMAIRGQTACSVVFATWQFSWPANPVMRQVPRNAAAWSRSLRGAYAVLVEDAPDLTGGADHFYDPRVVSPIWARRVIRRPRIGNHLFLTLPSRRWR